MVAGAIAGNISAEATTPTGNSFAEAMRGLKISCAYRRLQPTITMGNSRLSLTPHPSQPYRWDLPSLSLDSKALRANSRMRVRWAIARPKKDTSSRLSVTAAKYLTIQYLHPP